jgi:hypothetical protein
LLNAPHASRARRTRPHHRALVQAAPAVALENCAKRMSTSSTYARVRVHRPSRSRVIGTRNSIFGAQTRCRILLMIACLRPPAQAQSVSLPRSLASTPVHLPPTRGKKRRLITYNIFEKKQTHLCSTNTTQLKVWWYRMRHGNCSGVRARMVPGPGMVLNRLEHVN